MEECSYSFLVIVCSSLVPLLSALDLKSYAACYGTTGLDNFLQPSCAAGEKMAVRGVYTYAKLKSSGCPQEITFANSGTTDPACCEYDPNDCSFFYSSGAYQNYYKNCNGKQSCLIQVAWVETPCDKTLYIERTHYMKMDYYCIADQALDPCSDLTTTDSPAFFWNSGFPNELTAGSVSCSCSLEMSCDTGVEILALDLSLESDSSSTCQQSITVTENGVTTTIDCSSNNDYLPTRIYSSSNHFLTLQVINNLAANGGKYFIQIAGTNPNGQVTLSCGTAILSSPSIASSSLPTCPINTGSTSTTVSPTSESHSTNSNATDSSVTNNANTSSSDISFTSTNTTISPVNTTADSGSSTISSNTVQVSDTSVYTNITGSSTISSNTVPVSDTSVYTNITGSSTISSNTVPVSDTSVYTNITTTVSTVSGNSAVSDGPNTGTTSFVSVDNNNGNMSTSTSTTNIPNTATVTGSTQLSNSSSDKKQDSTVSTLNTSLGDVTITNNISVTVSKTPTNGSSFSGSLSSSNYTRVTSNYNTADVTLSRNINNNSTDTTPSWSDTNNRTDITPSGNIANNLTGTTLSSNFTSNWTGTTPGKTKGSSGSSNEESTPVYVIPIVIILLVIIIGLLMLFYRDRIKECIFGKQVSPEVEDVNQNINPVFAMDLSKHEKFQALPPLRHEYTFTKATPLTREHTLFQKAKETRQTLQSHEITDVEKKKKKTKRGKKGDKNKKLKKKSNKKVKLLEETQTTPRSVAVNVEPKHVETLPAVTSSVGGGMPTLPLSETARRPSISATLDISDASGSLQKSVIIDNIVEDLFSGNIQSVDYQHHEQ